LFSPEHGLEGGAPAGASVSHGRWRDLPLYSLHGETRKPTPEMLQGIDLLIYDIQDIGCRSYTYLSTLCCVMEAAGEHGLPLLLLDRPNPMGGRPSGWLLEEGKRSFVGRVDVPYCHGMTLGELAQLINDEEKMGCDLQILPMEGWSRGESWQATFLPWVPTSPHIPEAITPFYYATTGILGELSLFSVGIGTLLPFRLVGAPWIDGEALAFALRSYSLPGICWTPYRYTPHYGRFQGQLCHGVLLSITDPSLYRPGQGFAALLAALSLSCREHLQGREVIASFNAVMGGGGLQQQLLQGPPLSYHQLLRSQRRDERAFAKRCRPYLLY
ncbi:MAG: DUF1343 domain-containing protein, partial [Chlamydiota bacterium]|nr:DUF1343 domain-containing protein [Chlamydiota bacterium]